MPTPALPAFDYTKPDPAAQNITQFGQSARDNDLHNQIAAAIKGAAGWARNWTYSGGQLTQLDCSKGVLRVRVVYAWATSGPDEGRITTGTVTWSNDSGSSYGAVFTKTFTYNGDGTVASEAIS